ncbi:MAG: putative inorganic carbon transporter subunit DabA, partial [Pseudomonadota bacterium]
MTQAATEPLIISNVLKAAETAARFIPPAFPLDATVAVNPFLGQADEDMAHAAARLARVAGVRATQERTTYAKQVSEGRISDDDLLAALDDSASALKPPNVAALKASLSAPSPRPQALPTIADLARAASGADWPAIISRSFGLWAAGYFDRGQAFWTPAPGLGAFASWRAWATNDMTPEIFGLRGFCAHVAAAPDTADRAIMRAANALGLTAEAAETAFHRLLIDLGGWSQHARWLSWQAELYGQTDETLTDLLAIRLIWEEALLAQFPAVAEAWRSTVPGHAEPIAPTADQVLDAILQTAAERAYQRQVVAKLTPPKQHNARPPLQASFCIDVRSEVFRRAFEAQSPGVATVGFAGFFGLPLAHKSQASDIEQGHMPVLLTPAFTTESRADEETEEAFRITSRASRAWGRFRQAAVSSFAFVEAAGPAYGWKLVKDALGIGGKGLQPEPAPHVVGGLTAEQKANTAAAVLRAMSLTENHARLILLLGH